MKGIAHFVTGVAIATFFPEVVERAGDGSLLPVLGGVAGILPDTFDFRFLRYYEVYDLEIDPGPKPDPCDIAEQLAEAMRQAYESGESRSVMLHTIRLGPDRWRQYTVRFDALEKEIAVRIGPIVNTAQVPFPGSEPSPPAHSLCPTLYSLTATPAVQEIHIDIFSGPSLTFERQGDLLRVDFLAWHRRWSHSLTLAAALGLGAAAIAAVIELLTLGGVTRTPILAGLVVAFGLVGHILADQLGSLGSNLFFPLTRTRTRGLGLLRSGDAVPNFLTVWVGIMLIMFNLDRFSGQSRLTPWWAFMGLAVALPMVLLGGVYGRQRGREEPEAREALRQREILSEIQGTDID